MRSILRSYRRHKRYVWGFAALAALTALVVALSLRQQGNAMVRTEKVLDCPVTGMVAHTHDESCYDSNGNLVCSLPERELHVHDDSCYTEERVLTCGLEEDEGHVHTDECYEVVRTLTCGQDEVTEAHVHGAGCFETVTVDDGEGGSVQEEMMQVAPPAESSAVAQEDPTLAETHPAQTFKHLFKDAEDNLVLRVDVQAPVGALPKGTTMVATWVDPAQLADDEQAALDKALADKADGQVLQMQAVDISFRNAVGAEVEPANDVTVTMTSGLVDTDDQAVVVHIEDDKQMKERKGDEREAQVVDTLSDSELERRKVSLADNQLSFDSDQFSTYVLAVTSLHKVMQASDGATVTVTVDAPAEAGIPQDAELQVQELAEGSRKYVTYSERAAEALGASEGLAYARLFDISILVDGEKIQPARPVAVQIELADANGNDLHVVHFADDATTPDVMKSVTIDGTTVSFEASGFSIYAITDTAKRLQYNFYDGRNLLVSEYIKKEDNRLQELYEPSVEPEYGQTFVGWAYSPNETDPSKIYTIQEINQQATQQYNTATEELTTINLYAIYDEAWYLRYMDQDAQGNATVLNVVRVRKDAADKNVTIDYAFTPEEGIVFEGWIDVATGQTYQYGESITLDHHVDLYLKIHGRNWLVFDSNAGGPGSGATYTPPQLLIGSEATTEQPDDPTRKGYTFIGWNTKADGTGTWWYKTDGSVNRFGNTLSADATLYAQWEANDTDYYVVFWRQKATATGTDPAKDYDYVSSDHRTEKTGETVSTTAADRQKGGTVGSEYGYYFTYDADNSDTSATVDANGTTILNVYYNRREITYVFDKTVYTYQSTSSTSTSPTQYGLIDGEYIELTRSGSYGRYVWNYYTYSPTTTYNYNTQYYGLVNGTYVPIAYYDRYGWLYQSGNWYQYYTGTRYTRNTQTYTGQRYTRTTETIRDSYSGLYGSSFDDWPDPGNDMVWRESTTAMLFPLALTEFDPQAAYTEETTKTTVTFQSIEYDTGTTLVIYKQTVDGTWEYTDENLITTANLGASGRWYPTETFTGFELDAYRLSQNGSWVSITSSGSVDYDGHLDLRYARNQHNIHFISQGNHVTQRAEHIVEGVYYEADLSKYGVGGSSYYEPSNGNDGYYFAGWYADSDCQIPFDFNTTMPDADITVYAKWDTYRVRAVLVPTPDNAHNDEVELANNQSLSFRLNYNEEISDANINSSVAKRPGYKLIGWYYSPDFDPATEIHFPAVINKDTPGVDMNYQSGEDWNKYGDNDGSHDNVQGILKLYAKWELDVDESSVYVEYDVDGVYRTYDTAGMLQTTIPVDGNKYALTNSNVTFQVAEAPTEYTPGFEFYRWVLLNPDGSESNISYNPADTASEVPSSFIYEETITDDLGKTATIKKIRLKAKFNIETEKVTTVTFDGNGGVTNDSACLESVTESYPINKDFTMKNEDSFVREGYTLVGWAFQRTDGSLVTADEYRELVANSTPDQLIQLGIYEPGQDVAADNLEVSDVNNWEPLENTIYAIWEPHEFTVKVTKVVDGETANDKQFAFTAKGLSDNAEDTEFSLVNRETKTVTKVPYGTTFKLTETPCAGYAVKSVVAEQTSDANNEALSRPVVLEGKDGKTYTVKGDIEITYTNKRAAVPVQIVKIDQEGNALEGATFSISGGDISETGLESKIPKDGTEALIYKNESLPLGTYTLTETDAPDGYIALEGDVTVTVGIEGSDVVVTAKVGDTDIPADRIVRDEETGLWTVKVMNSAGVELPAAGGVGTWPMTLAGIAMMAGAAAWLLLGARRRA